MSFFSYPVRLACHVFFYLSRSFVIEQLVSLYNRKKYMGADTGCAGCGWVEIKHNLVFGGLW